MIYWFGVRWRVSESESYGKYYNKEDDDRIRRIMIPTVKFKVIGKAPAINTWKHLYTYFFILPFFVLCKWRIDKKTMKGKWTETAWTSITYIDAYSIYLCICICIPQPIYCRNSCIFSKSVYYPLTTYVVLLFGFNQPREHIPQVSSSSLHYSRLKYVSSNKNNLQ